jgi:hypothetical protein
VCRVNCVLIYVKTLLIVAMTHIDDARRFTESWLLL